MTMAERDRPTALDPASLEALEDQRDFLLSSLEDLERARAAGDVDDTDYQTLKDDYTARAASVIRSIEAGSRRARSETPTSDSSHNCAPRMTTSACKKNIIATSSNKIY